MSCSLSQLYPNIQVSDCNLYQHQVDALLWMAWLESRLTDPRYLKGGILADDMGLGKTTTFLALTEVHRVPFTLIIGPKSTVSQWYYAANIICKNCSVYTVENGKFRPVFIDKNTNRVAYGTFLTDIITPFSPKQNIILIINYEMVLSQLSLINKYSYYRIGIDEGHYIRSGDEVNIYKSIVQINQPYDQFGNRIGSRFVITGTPVSNYQDDIMPLYNFIDEQGLVVKRLSIEDLVRHYLFRRRTDQIKPELKKEMNLPDNDPIVHYEKFSLKDTNLSIQLASFSSREEILNYLFQNPHLFKELERDEKSFTIAAYSSIVHNNPSIGKQTDIRTLFSCPKFCKIEYNGYSVPVSYQGRVSRIDAVINITNSLEEKRAIVFYNFNDTADAIQTKLQTKGYNVFRVDGSSSGSARDKIISDARDAANNGYSCFILASMKACSEGLNFQFCSKVIFTDQDWNPKNEEQAICRVKRIGQLNKVYVWYVISEPIFCNGYKIDMDGRFQEVKQRKEIYSEIINNNAALYFKRYYINGEPGTYFGHDFESLPKGSFNGPDSEGPEYLFG